MKPKNLLKLLKHDGWFIVAQRGSHIQLKHPTKTGKVTIPNHNTDLPIGTYKSILKQAGL